MDSVRVIRCDPRAHCEGCDCRFVQAAHLRELRPQQVPHSPAQRPPFAVSRSGGCKTGVFILESTLYTDLERGAEDHREDACLDMMIKAPADDSRLGDSTAD